MFIIQIPTVKSFGIIFSITGWPSIIPSSTKFQVWGSTEGGGQLGPVRLWQEAGKPETVTDVGKPCQGQGKGKSKNQCCVFWLAFDCCAHPKADQTTFFSRFQAFLFILNLFQWFHSLNQQKTSENEQKSDICLLLKFGRHAKAGWLPEGVPRNHLFLGAFGCQPGFRSNTFLWHVFLLFFAFF